MGSLERPKKGRFERKVRDEKKNEKKGEKAVASAGSADPGKEGFRVGKWGRQSLARLRSSLGWAGGFHVLRTDRRAGVGLHSVVAEESCYSMLIRIWFDVVAIKVAKST